jgi:hypothetical protein
MKTTFHSYQDQGSLLRDYTIVSMCLEANSLEMISKYHTDHLLCQISKSLKKSNMANYSKSKQSKIFCLVNQTLQQLNHNFVKHISYY